VPTILAAPLLRWAYNRWGTTKGEGEARMPGDDLIVAPKLTHTRSITIEAPAEEIWPWLAQIGQGRGGLYSYDSLENAVGCDLHSADHIIEDLQAIGPGDLIRLGPTGYPAFRVVRSDPPRELVLISAEGDAYEPPPTPVVNGSAPVTTWAWRLLPLGRRRSRLVTRQRCTYPTRQSILWHVVEPIGFVMERKMLRGIRRRAERSAGREGGAVLNGRVH
jgi:hypothetical protein